MDNIASLIVSPEYSCQIEFGYCLREWYKLDELETYANRVMIAKPEFLKNDDFLNFMYNEIEADT